MKIIIRENKKILNATTDWTSRMGDTTPEEFAEITNGHVVEIPDYIDLSNLNINFFKENSDGSYSFNYAKYDTDLYEKKMAYIRNKRDWECFRYVNRGQVWYDTLTQEQREEIQTWYADWLNLTNREDLNIDNPQYPTPPSFIKDFVSYEDTFDQFEDFK